jgi:hypothetical protein
VEQTVSISSSNQVGRAGSGRHGTQLFLGRTPADPFYPSTIRLRALKAWGWKQMPNPVPRARAEDLDPRTGPTRLSR